MKKILNIIRFICLDLFPFCSHEIMDKDVDNVNKCFDFSSKCTECIYFRFPRRLPFYRLPKCRAGIDIFTAYIDHNSIDKFHPCKKFIFNSFWWR